MFKYDLIIILGGPASGKGTLCSKLTTNFSSIVHVSPGELLRNNNEISDEMTKNMNKGKLLPASFIGQLIMSHIRKNFYKNKTIVLDGFPRNKYNLDYFNDNMKDNFNLLGVFVLACDDDIMIERVSKRIHSSARDDDTIKVFKNRLKIYHDETEEIIKFFDKILIIHSGGSAIDTYNQCIKCYKFK